MCVVSAIGTEPNTKIKVTDLLINIVDLASRGDKNFIE